MAFILEQAGGRATDGFNRILSKDVTALHQRSAIVIGSKNMVLKVEELMNTYSSKNPNEKAEAKMENMGIIGGLD